MPMKPARRYPGTSALKTAGKLFPRAARRWLRAKFCPNTLWPYRNFLVSRRYRFVYCWIPKVGCTTVKTWFVEAQGDRVERGLPGGIHRQAADRHAFHLMGPIETRRVLKGYHHFVVVRNPWNRIASAFMDKFVREPVNYQNIPVIEAVHRQKGGVVSHSTTFPWESLGVTTELPIDPKVPYEHGITFREFVDYLSSRSDHGLDGHWRPQSNFLGSRRFDRIVRLEELAEGISRLEEELGMPHVALRHLHRGKRGNPDTSAPGTLADVPAGELRERPEEFGPLQLMTPELAERIGQRYAADADAFGYRCPDEFKG